MARSRFGTALFALSLSACYGRQAGSGLGKASSAAVPIVREFLLEKDGLCRVSSALAVRYVPLSFDKTSFVEDTSPMFTTDERPPDPGSHVSPVLDDYGCLWLAINRESGVTSQPKSVVVRFEQVEGHVKVIGVGVYCHSDLGGGGEWLSSLSGTVSTDCDISPGDRPLRVAFELSGTSMGATKAIDVKGNCIATVKFP